MLGRLIGGFVIIIVGISVAMNVSSVVNQTINLGNMTNTPCVVHHATQNSIYKGDYAQTPEKDCQNSIDLSDSPLTSMLLTFLPSFVIISGVIVGIWIAFGAIRNVECF